MNIEIQVQSSEYRVPSSESPHSVLGTRYSELSLQKKGFTLVEVLVGSAVFLVIALAAYNAYIGLFNLVSLSQYRVIAVALANERFEVMRNMPYSQIGIQGGIPNGVIPHEETVTRGGISFVVTTTVRNIDLPFDGTIGGTPNDTSPADNKSVDIEISCDTCKNMQPIRISGQIAPKNLETLSTNGALFVRVFDGNGQPVQGADVHVVNVATTTTIIIDDVTDATGMLQLVDVPPGVNAYRITVSKSGYSSERTYPLGDVSNPNPSKPDATVVVQQVTQVSFAIDRLGSLAISSVSPLCVAVPGFDFSMTGSKVIGTGVSKYSQSLATDGSGLLDIGSVEWDTYTIVPTDGAYDTAGFNPLNPVTVNPGAAQSMQMIVVPRDPRSIMVTVRDNATQLPVSGADVTLTSGVYSDTQTTGKGFINQTDWSGGDGQSIYSDATKYFTASFTAVSSPAGEIKLSDDGFGSYNPDGTLESSTFDTGSNSNFYSLVWSPGGAPASTTVRFQLATATTSSPTSWNFVGPDGTASTYYTVSDSAISTVHNGDRYLRYKAYLHSDSSTVTPNISDVAFTFTSSCTPPGQVIFTGLSSGTYHVHVVKTGYSDGDQDVSASGDWQEVPIILAP